jgi:hypothetical protein
MAANPVPSNLTLAGSPSPTVGGAVQPLGSRPTTATTPSTSTTSPTYLNPTATGVNVSPTSAGNSLLGQTITPGAMANPTNIANSNLQNWQQQQAPIYASNIRQATSAAAGAGQLGSGQLNTSLGNLAYNQNQATNAAMGNFTNQAQQQEIQDAYNNIGIEQQQQGFQAGEQNTGFNQGLQSLLAGESGNPASTQLALSGNYGQQASQGLQGLSSLIGGTTSGNAQNAYLQQLLQQQSQLNGTGGYGASTPSYTGSSPLYGSLGNAGSYVGNGVSY